MNVDAELWVDTDVWEDAVARVTSIADDLHGAARRPRTPGTVRTSTTLAMFTMAPDARATHPEDGT